MSKPKEIRNRTKKRFYIYALKGYPVSSRGVATIYTVLDELNMHREMAVYGPSPTAEEKAKRLCDKLNREDG